MWSDRLPTKKGLVAILGLTLLIGLLQFAVYSVEETDQSMKKSAKVCTDATIVTKGDKQTFVVRCAERTVEITSITLFLDTVVHGAEICCGENWAGVAVCKSSRTDPSCTRG